MRTGHGRLWPFVAAAGLLAGIGVVVAARRYLDVVEVQGTSMAPAMLPGDRLLVESLSYRRRAPRTGEIVLALDPRAPERELIKRVHAVGPDVDLRGDAAASSTDSRSFGSVPLAQVRWRAMLRYTPLRRVAMFRTAGPSSASRGGPG